MSDPADAIQELASTRLSHKFGVRKELKAAGALIAAGERVVDLAAGQYDDKQGLLIVTDRRLIFYEKGMVRSTQEDFPLDRISSIQSGTSMMTGKLTIHVSGNRASIDKVMPKVRASEIGDYIRGRISGGGPASTPEPAAAAADPRERLAKLQAMLDDGIISPAEFAEQRQRVLAEM